MDEENNEDDTEREENIKEDKKWMIWLPALLIIGLIVGAGGVYLYQKSRISPQPAITDEPTTETVEEPSPESENLRVGENAIVVTGVAPGKSVRIDSITLASPGYVVIHEDKEGSPGDVIGHSDLLEAGTTENIDVDISRKSVKGEVLYAMLHKDDGNSKFDFPGDDGPVVNENQDPIMMRVVVGEQSGGEVKY